MKISTCLALALLLPATSQAAAAADLDLPQRVYTYELDLDANGSVQSIAPHGFEADATSRQLDEEIRGWIFEAAAREGAGAAMRTYLRVVVAQQDKAGTDYELVAATTGPAPRSLALPDYPFRDQIRGSEGTVVLELGVGADGRVGEAQVRKVTGDASRAMANAALSAARDWTFTPEQVNGTAVPGTLLWPVCFLARDSSATNCAWDGPDAQRLSSKTVLTLDPTVRVVSPIALQQR